MDRGGVDVGRAQRWFWSLVVIAVLAMSVLYDAIYSEPGVTAGVLVLVSSSVLAAVVLQAARIFRVLNEPRRGRRLG